MLPSFVNGLFTMRVVLAAGFMFIAALAPTYAQESASPFEARIAEARSAMMADPATALNLANEAEALAGQNRVEWLTAQWLQGEALNRLNRPQEAAPILDAALEGAGEVAPNTKLHGDLMMARAGAARAQSYLDKSLIAGAVLMLQGGVRTIGAPVKTLEEKS